MAQQLRKLTASLTPQDQEATLSTLRRIFDNIIQYPNDDKYRQIKLTGKVFSSKVWQYPAGEELMKISGWVVEDDHVRLRDDSCVQMVSQLLKQDLEDTKSAPHSILGKRHRIDDHQSTSTDHSNLPKCCALTEDIACEIMVAINCGDGIRLRELLEPYHNSCVKSMQLAFDDPVSITVFVFMVRQIGIARILVNEYGLDVNITGEDGDPCFLKLFDGCDSTEPCQSMIIQFIKEFKINVHKYTCVFTALHYAVLHKLFSVVKFLVEDCKIDINCTSNASKGCTPLHVAYGMGEKNIAQYLIEHGANLEALDNSGRKPKDHEFYGSSYVYISKYLIKRRIILKNFASPEYIHFQQLRQQGISKFDAVDLILEKFPSLQKCVDGGYVSWSTLKEQNANGGLVNQRILEATPTLKELNRYITKLAPSYYNIGLQLDIVNSQLKLIKNDPSLSDLREKCRKMLEVWLENDTSATWKKLYDALEEVEQSVLAEEIKTTLP